MERNGVFISYASEDVEHAQRMYDDLKKAGLEPWLDKVNLLPGQKWQPALREAIRKSRYFIALISKASTEKIGYVQSEFRQALEILDEFPDTEIYVIPARLEDSTPTHQKLQEIQWVDLFPCWEEGVQRILEAMKVHISEEHSVSPGTEQADSVDDPVELKPRAVQVSFDTQESVEDLKGRLFAIIVEWVEFDHITETYNSLDFPGGKYRSGLLELEPDGLPPLPELLLEFGENYTEIRFLFDHEFDIGDLVSRSRGGTRNMVSVSKNTVVFNVTAYTTVTVRNRGEAESSVSVISSGKYSKFQSGAPPIPYSAVLDFLMVDPVTNALSSAIAISTEQVV